MSYEPSLKGVNGYSSYSLLTGELVSKAVDVKLVSQNRHGEDGSPSRRFAVAILNTSSLIPNAV
jgi:hypothetical protein